MLELLEQVGGYLGIERWDELLPSSTAWSRDRAADGAAVIRVDVPVQELCENFQDDGASTCSLAGVQIVSSISPDPSSAKHPSSSVWSSYTDTQSPATSRAHSSSAKPVGLATRSSSQVMSSGMGAV